MLAAVSSSTKSNVRVPVDRSGRFPPRSSNSAGWTAVAVDLPPSGLWPLRELFFNSDEERARNRVIERTRSCWTYVQTHLEEFANPVYKSRLGASICSLLLLLHTAVLAPSVSSFLPLLLFCACSDFFSDSSVFYFSPLRSSTFYQSTLRVSSRRSFCRLFSSTNRLHFNLRTPLCLLRPLSALIQTYELRIPAEFARGPQR